MRSRFNLRTAAVLAAFSVAGRLAAQDVTVGSPVWVMTSPAPDEMPVIKSFLFSPSFPRQMRGTGEIGYATFAEFVSAENPKQHLLLNGGVIATEPHFQKAVEDEMTGWSPKPARNQGVPVDTAVWVAVIFNPASAGKRNAEATPRLLEATPVFVGSKRTGGREEPFLVRVKISVDATGAVARVLAESEDYDDVMAPIARAVRKWHFAPARQGGQPVAAEVTMPVIVQAPARLNGQAMKLPVVVKQVEAEYPVSMRYLELRGQVEADIVVELDGSVSNPTIISSDNPAFDEPAIDALLQWKFRPAERNGQPVKTHMRETIVFELDGPLGGGGSAYSTMKESGGGTAATIRGALVPVFPYQLRRDGISGHATVRALVNERGKVVNLEIAKASRPEFGYALAAALEGFTFFPAVADGKPESSLVEYPYEFSFSRPSDSGESDAMYREKRHPDSIHGASELDAPLRPISRRAGLFPPSLQGKFAEGHAVVEFLIDDKGHARLPRIVQADDPLFGYAAVQAVSTWWFDSPKIQGKPAFVRVRVPFVFKLQKNP